MEGLLEVKNLKKHFPVTKGVFRRIAGKVKAVDDISFSIPEGETFALVGESGCGKTTTARVILLLEEASEGSIFFQDKDIFNLERKELKWYRRSVQAIFQNPYSSLSPRKRVGAIVADPLVVNNLLPKDQIKEKVNEALGKVGLGKGAANQFPHEFSGGQRQRIAIARALSLYPSLIILDEPVSALDVSVQAQIMNLLKALQEKSGVSYLLIAHQLATIRYMSHQMGVMYLGKLVEQGPCEEIFRNPHHPYTKALLSAALPSHPNFDKEEIVLSGEVPTALNPPAGCGFHPRCYRSMPVCSEVKPQVKEVTPNHYVACHL